VTVGYNPSPYVSPAYLEGYSDQTSPYTALVYSPSAPQFGECAAFLSAGHWYNNVPLNSDGTPTILSFAQVM